MENQSRFCTHCGSALSADARFCPMCGTTLGQAPENPATPAQPTRHVPLGMPIVGMIAGIVSFIFSLISLEEGLVWDEFIFFLFVMSGIALAMVFGLMNLKPCIATRRINGIIFCAVGLGAAAMASTFNLIELLLTL